MIRLLARAARWATALLVALIALAASRWAPVEASPPWDVRALPLFGPAVALAALAAACGGPRRTGPWRPIAGALAATLALLAAVVGLRPAAGLPADASGPQGVLGVLPAGPVTIDGPRLHALEAVRKWTFRWDGPLRAPASGRYRLWAVGRGRVEVDLDGARVLDASGEDLRAGALVPIGAGGHHLRVTLTRTGPGPRLRLGWTRPDGRDETIPARDLGPPRAAAWWIATDVLALGAAALLGALVVALPWDAPRRAPSPSPFTGPEAAVSLGAYGVLFALMSWPLVTAPAHLGVMDRPDGRLVAWMLAWDAHAVFRQPSGLWNAPVFHPLPDALAFSENLILPALAVAPLQRLGGPVLAYNAALALAMIVSGLGTQMLIRRVGGDRLAAFVGGAVFAFGAHRWIRLAHLHAQVTMFLPLALWALDRFWERRTLRRGLAVGLMLALQAWSSIYLAAVTALALGVAVLLALAAGLGRRGLLALAAAGVLALALVAPVAGPYLRMRAFQGVEWSMADVAAYATTLTSYAASGSRLYGAVTQRHLDPAAVQDTLFPGVVTLVLGLAGLAGAPRRFRAVALAASVIAIVISLGPQTALYRVLHEHLVFVRGVRALSRFSLVPVLALSVLAGLALSGRRRLALPALALVLLESANAPIGFQRSPVPSAADRWLAGRPGAVARLPLGEDDTRAMFDAIAHWRPLLNGDSGFVPRPYSRAMELLEAGPSSDAMRLLRALGVTHVRSSSPLDLPQAARFGDERVFDVPGGDVAAGVDAAPPRATLWTGEGLVVDLGASRAVDRIVFQVDERPWVGDPAVAVSSDGQAWESFRGLASLADATLSLYRDPRRGRGSVRFGPVATRFVRLDPRLPARRGMLEVP